MTGTQTPPRALRRTRESAGLALPARLRAGPVDHLSVKNVLALIPTLPLGADVAPRCRATRLQAASTILDWLHQQPGEGWQQRWLAAGADQGTQWLDEIVAGDPRSPAAKGTLMTCGVACLILCRVVLPG